MSSFWKKRLFIVSSKLFGKYTISDHYQHEVIELSNIIDSIYDVVSKVFSLIYKMLNRNLHCSTGHQYHILYLVEIR